MEKEVKDIDLTEEENGATEEKEADEKDSIDFGLNIFAFEKWGKQQFINLFDFSSLNGVVSTIKGILVVVLFVLLIRKKK